MRMEIASDLYGRKRKTGSRFFVNVISYMIIRYASIRERRVVFYTGGLLNDDAGWLDMSELSD